MATADLLEGDIVQGNEELSLRFQNGNADAFDESDKIHSKTNHLEELVFQYQEGDEEAFNELLRIDIEHRRKMTFRGFIKIKDRYPSVAFNEIEGVVDAAYFKAAKDYDSSKGASFRTYLHYCIFNEIDHFIRVLFGNTQTQKGRLKRRFHLTKKSLSDLDYNDKRLLTRMVLEAKKSESNVGSIIDIIEKVPLIFEGMPERDKKIIYLRYGLGLTFEEIGEKLYITRQRAGQIINRIDAKIKFRGLKFEYNELPILKQAIKGYYEKGFASDKQRHNFFSYCHELFSPEEYTLVRS